MNRSPRRSAAAVRGLAAPAALAVALAGPAAAQCELAPLLPSPEVAGALFGSAVALDGDTAVVAAGTNVSPTGDVRVFERVPGGGWTEVDQLASPAVQPGDSFGLDVALEGDLAVVTAPGDGDMMNGAAYVFERGPAPGDGWSEVQKLVPSAPDQGEFMGWSVDVDEGGDRIVLGGHNLIYGPGEVHVFERDPATGLWVDDAVLHSDAPFLADQFGSVVAVDGDRILVGAPNTNAPAVHVFERSASGWDWVDLLVSDVPGFTNFGNSVDLDGDRALVGAPFGQQILLGPGTTYVFEPSPTGWVRTAKLDDTAYGATGTAVAWSEGRILSSAPYLTSNRVVVYEEGPLGWVQTATLAAPAPAVAYGVDLAVDGGRVLIGAARYDGAAADSGAVFEWSVEALCSPVETIALASGGAQPMALSAGPKHPLGIYLVLGSASGTSPGQNAGALNVPLNLDAYYLHTLLHPNGSVIQNSLGFLDALGRSSAPELALPPGLVGLAGLTLHHAFVVLDLVPTPTVPFASNALPLTL